MKMTKRAICLFLAAVMALALTIPVLAADDFVPAPEAAEADLAPAAPAMAEEEAAPVAASVGVHTVELTDAKGTNFGTANVTDGKLDALDDASREGWDFEGWYTGEVTEKVDLSASSAKEGTYWKWQISAAGKAVKAGDVISDDVTKLYAKFKPHTVEYAMYPCGWNNNFGALYATRQYGVPFTGAVISWNVNWDPQTDKVTVREWPGYVFDGWWTTLNDDGIRLDNGADETISKHPVGDFDAVYLHWHKADDESINQTKYRYDPGHNVDTKLTSLSLASIKPLHVGQTITVKLGTTPDRANLEGITWESDNPDAVTVTPRDNEGLGNTYGANGQRADIYAKGEGTATITARVGSVSVSVKVTARHEYKTVHTENATCTEAGSKQQECTYPGCTARKTVEIPALRHSFTTKKTFPNSCDEDGYTLQTCGRCGIVEKVDIVPAHGHNMTNPQVIEGCGETVTINTCSICGHTETTTTAGNGQHQWDDEYTVDKAATCVDLGSESIHCAKCSITKDSQPIPATGKHSFPSKWTTVTPANWEHEGLKERKCTVCGAKETEVIPVSKNSPGGSGGGGAAPAPEETPEPTPTPEVTPEPTPDPEATPTPAPAPVEPPKTNNGSGWVYDEATGADYYFINGEMKKNYWAADKGASKWNFWYYVDESGKLERGLQYIENPNGTGWYMLQVSNDNGCRGKLLDGLQQTDIAGPGMFISTRGADYGKCTWTEAWGTYDESTGLWSDGQSHR